MGELSGIVGWEFQRQRSKLHESRVWGPPIKGVLTWRKRGRPALLRLVAIFGIWLGSEGLNHSEPIPFVGYNIPIVELKSRSLLMKSFLLLGNLSIPA